MPETLRCCKAICCTHCIEQCRSTGNNYCPHCREPEPVTKAIRHKGIDEIIRENHSDLRKKKIADLLDVAIRNTELLTTNY